MTRGPSEELRGRSEHGIPTRRRQVRSEPASIVACRLFIDRNERQCARFDIEPRAEAKDQPLFAADRWFGEVERTQRVEEAVRGTLTPTPYLPARPARADANAHARASDLRSPRACRSASTTTTRDRATAGCNGVRAAAQPPLHTCGGCHAGRGASPDRRFRHATDRTVERLLRERRAVARQEQTRFRRVTSTQHVRPRLRQILTDEVHRDFADRHHAILLELPLQDRHVTAIEVDVARPARPRAVTALAAPTAANEELNSQARRRRSRPRMWHESRDDRFAHGRFPLRGCR